MKMHSHFVEREGLRIHCLEAGKAQEGNPALLFVPGIMMPAWIWEKQLDYFSKNYRVVAMEPRSQGDSTQTGEGHDAFTKAQDIQAVIEQLKLKPLILVGWSIAVAQVVNYAARLADDRLKGLVLVDGIVGADSSLPFYQPMIDQWSRFQLNRKEETKNFRKIIFHHQQSESFLDRLEEAALRTPTATVMTSIYNYILQDFRPLLPSIHVPTLITTVDGPRLSYMEAMAQRIPRCTLQKFTDAGHALFIDQPEAFNQALEKFISSLKVGVPMSFAVAEECGKLSEEEKISFPEVVARLAQSGIESYTVNFLVPNKIFYRENQAQVFPLKLTKGKEVAAQFNAEGVKQAIRHIQSQTIGYQEFLKQIMDAGTLCYTVYITGRKVVYTGRKGEEHVEPFP